MINCLLECVHVCYRAGVHVQGCVLGFVFRCVSTERVLAYLIPRAVLTSRIKYIYIKMMSTRVQIIIISSKETVCITYKYLHVSIDNRNAAETRMAQPTTKTCRHPSSAPV